MTQTQQVGLGIRRNPLSARNAVELLKDVFQSPQFWDGIKVFGVGAAIAGSKWIAESIWDSVKRFVLARAVFRGEDDTYNWVMHYLTSTGHWSVKARDVEIRCRSGAGVSEQEDHDSSTGADASKLQRGQHSVTAIGLPKGVNMVPLESTSLHFTFEGTHVFAVRDRKLVGDSNWEEVLSLSFLTLSSAVIRKFIAVAKQSYDEHQRGKVQIFNADRYNYWSRSKTITKRLSDSVHLPANMKEALLRDAEHFIDEETKLWYSDRGIPYRRGYLFYGVPGSGKTSLAHVLASELELPIYQCNLSGRGMDDNKFQELMTSIPDGVIVVLEDVDAAFTSRTAAAEAADEAKKSGPGGPTGGLANAFASSALPPSSASGTSTPLMMSSALGGPTGSSNISFSSLLNAIDGIGASDSRLLIMTTNHRSLLDDALIRPGRIDLQFEFKNADAKQAKELFVRWFSPSPSSRGGGGAKKTQQAPQDDDDDDDDAVVPPLTEKEATTMKMEARQLLSGGTESQLPVRQQQKQQQQPRREVGTPFSKFKADAEEIESSANVFVDNVPELSYSVAALQGYLLTCSAKTPRQAAEGVKEWVRQQETQA